MKPRRWILLWTFVLATSLVVSPAPVFAQAKKAAPAAKTLSNEECEAFAKELQSKWDDGDVKAVIKAMDADAMLDRSVTGITVPAQTMQGLRAGFTKGFLESFERAMGSVEDYHYLRFRKVGAESRLVFRLVTDGGGMNYHELILARGANGKPRIVDIYVYMSGEKLTETFQRLLVPLLAEGQKSMLDKLFADKPDLVKHQADWQELVKLSTQGKNKQVLATYAKLPASLQKEKFLLLLRLKASMDTDEKEYLAALDLWRKTYPNDASIDLVSIDAYVLRKQYPKAMECVDRLDKAVGGDPYLDYQRALLSKLTGSPAKMIEYAESAIKQEPTLFSAYDLILEKLVGDRKFSEAIKVLTRFQQTAGFTPKEVAKFVEEDRTLAPLVRSEEYKRWLGVAPAPAASATTKDGKAPAAPAATVPAPAGPRLQGIFYKQVGATATISGKVVGVGEQVGGLKVIAIERESVTLEAADGKKTTLSLNDKSK